MKNIKGVTFDERGARMFFIEFMKANRGAIDDNPLVQTARAFKLFLKNNCGWDDEDIRREAGNITALYRGYLNFYRGWRALRKYSLDKEIVIEFFRKFIMADDYTLRKIQSQKDEKNIISKRIEELIEIVVGIQVIPLPAIACN